ncbi:hypothetical protein J3454_12660 [Erythrobacter sp. NFXS35]|uniref:hypothetical protein n=1 Tax=Erythrobacter sp. NFXS35 TaxID=2818436 RepID=UPI0032DEE701
MKTIILAASVFALIPAAAQAQLLGGGGGLGGQIGGTLGGTLRGTISPSIGNTVDRTTRSVRSTVDGDAATGGSQSVDARNGRVAADRSANGSITGSTASLADLAVPQLGSAMGSASGSGSASGNGNASAQLIGTDAVIGTIAPAPDEAKGLAGDAAGQAMGTAGGMVQNAPMPGMMAVPALGSVTGGGSASGEGNGSASLTDSMLAVAGSAAAAGQGAASVAPGMPVMTPDGASLGKVREIVANGRGEIEQVVVKQGKVARTLPAGMFSASGDALIAGQAQGETGAERAEPAPMDGGEAK